MAYRRSLSIRATLFARRLNPSFGYISHKNDRDKHGEESFPQYQPEIDTSSLHRRYFGSFTNNSSVRRWQHDVGCNQMLGSSLLPMSLGGMFRNRYMSTTSFGEGSDRVEYVKDVATVLTDAPVDVIASQAPAVSEVAIAAADSAFPVAALQYVIDGVHSFTGLEWWASIAVTTLLIRGFTIPFLINQLKASTKLSLMRPRLEAIKEEMQQSMDPQAVSEGQKRMQAVFKEYGVTPFTPLKGLLIQGPLFISFFFAISNMVEKVPSFKTGGTLWFTDLTTPDSMYILPVLTALTFLITTELNMQEGLEGNPVAGTMKKFSRLVALVTVPFTMTFPKAIFCYWITSNLFSLAYGSVLKVTGVKKSLGLPEVPLAPEKTHRDSPSSQSGFSSLQAEQSKPLEHKGSLSSAALSHRMAILERKNKRKKRNGKK